MSGVPPTGAPGAEPEQKPRSALAERLLRPKVITGVVILVLAVWFILANTTHVRIHLWVTWVTAQLWIVLAVDLVAGMLLGFLLGRRNKDRKERPRR
jgi:uncharacterized integral membrane protein